MGLIFKVRVIVGGFDIIVVIMKRKYDIFMKNIFLFINFFVVCVGVFLFGVKLVMYILIIMYIIFFIMDIGKDCFDRKKFIFLILNKYDEIFKVIMNKMGRGVIFLEVEGVYI